MMYGWIDGWTNERKDNVKTVYTPHTNTVCGRGVHYNVIQYSDRHGLLLG